MATFPHYLQEKDTRKLSLSFIWQRQISGWPWPSQPTFNFSVVIPVYPCSLAPRHRHLSPLPGLILIYLRGPSISSLCLIHSFQLSSPLPIHLRAAEAHNRPHIGAPSIMTDSRPNRSGGKKSWFRSTLLLAGKAALRCPSWYIDRNNFWGKWVLLSSLQSHKYWFLFYLTATHKTMFA